MIANLGMMRSSSKPFFHSPYERIAQLDVSEPLDAVVAITPIPRTCSGVTPLSKKSQTSPSYGIPRAIAFAVSMELPPPTARTKSTLSSLPFATSFLTSSMDGFGTTSPLSENLIPSSFTASVMTS